MSEISSAELIYSVKNKSFTRKDTFVSQCRQVFYNSENADSFQFILQNFTYKNDYFYDGEFFYISDNTNKNLSINHYNWQQVYQALSFSNNVPITSQGKQLLKYTTAAKLRSKDTIANGKQFKLLHLYKQYPDFDSAFTNLNLYYFLNPENLLPEKYIFTIEGMGGMQYVELNLTNYKLNYLDEKMFRKVLNSKISKQKKDYKLIQNPGHADISQHTLDTGGIAPAFSLKNYSQADSVIFPSSKSKLYLLDFWYISCYPCQLAIPHLQKLYLQFSKNGLEVIGINVSERDNLLLPSFLQQHKVNYPIGLNGSDVAKKYGVGAYPSIFLVNADGIIVYRSIGYSEVAMNKLEQIIQNTIAK